MTQVCMHDRAESFEPGQQVLPQSFIGHEAGDEQNCHAHMLA
jgi:hypothetical protein